MATKQRNPGPAADILPAADEILAQIGLRQRGLDRMTANFNAEAARLKEHFEKDVAGIKAGLAADEKSLIALMKTAKGILFDGIDIVRLLHGCLIHAVTDKVSIPRDALSKCEELGFAEVVKITKSLDRDAVEKWPDAKLILIGAERKQREEFSYDIAKVQE